MGLLHDRKQTAQLFQRWGPVIHLRDADSTGVPRGLLQRQEDRGELLRVAKAAFVQTADWEAADDVEQFRRRSIGFGLCVVEDAHLTGAAAATLLELPLLSPPAGLPIAVRPGDPHIGPDRSPYGRIRHGHLPLVHRTIRTRVRTVSPAYAAVDIARHLGPLDGLIIADAALRRGVQRDAMFALVGKMQAYPGISTAQWVVERADPRSESPLETLGRYAFIEAGLAAPLSNVWMRAAGQWFRSDHLIPDVGVLLEADGAVKYNDRIDADDVVASEKERERKLRAAGYGLVRYTWADAVNQPWRIIQMAREAAELRPQMPVPQDWTLASPWGPAIGIRPTA